MPANASSSSEELPTKVHQVSVSGRARVVGTAGRGKRKHNINNFKRIVRPASYVYVCGTHSQADVRYPVHSRNKQCTAMAVFFLCYGSLNSAEDFDAGNIDVMLDHGDRLYRISFELCSDEDKKHPYLSYDMVHTPVELYESGSVVGHFDATFELLLGVEGSLRDLPILMESFFDGDRTHGVLTTCQLSFGFMKRNGFFFLFDSHANTLPCGSSGVAVLLKCTTSAEMANHISDRAGSKNNPHGMVSIGCMRYRGYTAIAPVPPPIANVGVEPAAESEKETTTGPRPAAPPIFAYTDTTTRNILQPLRDCSPPVSTLELSSCEAAPGMLPPMSNATRRRSVRVSIPSDKSRPLKKATDSTNALELAKARPPSVATAVRRRSARLSTFSADSVQPRKEIDLPTASESGLELADTRPPSLAKPIRRRSARLSTSSADSDQPRKETDLPMASESGLDVADTQHILPSLAKPIRRRSARLSTSSADSDQPRKETDLPMASESVLDLADTQHILPSLAKPIRRRSARLSASSSDSHQSRTETDVPMVSESVLEVAVLQASVQIAVRRRSARLSSSSSDSCRPKKTAGMPQACEPQFELCTNRPPFPSSSPNALRRRSARLSSSSDESRHPKKKTDMPLGLGSGSEVIISGPQFPPVPPPFLLHIAPISDVVMPVVNECAVDVVRTELQIGPETEMQPSRPSTTIIPPPNSARRNATNRKALFYDPMGICKCLIGECNLICQNCGARHFAGEVPVDKSAMSLCCNKGRTHFEFAEHFPAKLIEYMNLATPMSRFFMANILKINNNLAFASMETNICTPVSAFAVGQNRPEVIKVNGMITHLVHHLSERSAFVAGHTYMFETKDAVEMRVQQIEANHIERRYFRLIFSELEVLLRQINRFTSMFKMLKDVESERRTMVARGELVDAAIHLQILNVRNVSECNRNTAAEGNLIGRYSVPTSNQVCMVTSNLSRDDESRNVRIYPLSQPNAKQLSCLNPNRDALMYPLLFPFGEQSWHLFQSKRIVERFPCKNRNISHREWAAYVLQMRSNAFNPFLHAGKLANLFVIDTQMGIEKQFIEYIRANQKTLQMDRYSAIGDYLKRKADGEGLIPGRVIVLPSSFTLGERHHHKNYQDSMALATKYGKPSLFITFTCNPSWSEISSCLRPLERFEHRPDVMCRVFKLKLDELMARVTNGKYFGNCLGFSYTIEFQKRGWPHAHILLWLDEKDVSLVDPAGIDSVVSACIPDAVEDPELFDLVKRLHVHGPCGDGNPTMGCMQNGKCAKKFPYAFLAATVPNEYGYPVYRRPDDGRKIHMGNGRMADNRHVVPYNPTLLREFECHLNAEVVKSVQSIKYLHKYINKGCDQAVCRQQFFVQGTDNVLTYDETAAFVHTRYMCAVEATWHIYEMPMSKMSHTIYHLQIHLPGEQNVCFDGDDVDAAFAAGERTMLTAFFHLNSTDPMARKFLYKEIPEHFVYHTTPKTDRRWTRRKRGQDKIISRMYHVNPRNLELHALKVLLLHVRGPTSHEHLRTVNGTEFSTFAGAARALGLMASDQNWRDTMVEAVHERMPAELRALFVTICTFCGLSDPSALYEEFRDSLCEDHTRRGLGISDATDLLLNDLQRRLLILGKSLEDYNLPLPSHCPPQLIDTEDDLLADACERIEQLDAQVEMLNDGQRLAFDSIKSALECKTDPNVDRLFFIDGFGGSGKTFLYDTIIKLCNHMGIQYVATAFTGIAASLLKGGRTVHSVFRFAAQPITHNTTCGVRRQSAVATQLRNCELLIWDEVSQCPGRMLDAVDELMRELMANNLPFGGKTVVVGGDFRQCLPVIQGANKSEILNSIAKNSRVWCHFKTLRLTVNMRLVADDQEFLAWQLAIGEGRQIDAAGNAYFPELVAIPASMLVNSNVDDVVELLDRTYGREIRAYDLEGMAERMVLTVLNADVDRINALCLSRMLERRQATYFSVDSFKSNNDDGDFEVPIEVLNREIPPGFPPHELQLKMHSPIILLRNINPAEGLCNGSRLKVTLLRPHLIQAVISNGTHKGKRVFIPKILMEDTNNPYYVLSRLQFPVKLNFAMTINKSQGQSFSHVSLFLRRPVFGHGQLYVAISRAREKSKLTIQVCENASQGRMFTGNSTVYTPNIVYREVFD